jgi:hypothetical protein
MKRVYYPSGTRVEVTIKGKILDHDVYDGCMSVEDEERYVHYIYPNENEDVTIKKIRKQFVPDAGKRYQLAEDVISSWFCHYRTDAPGILFMTSRAGVTMNLATFRDFLEENDFQVTDEI